MDDAGDGAGILLFRFEQQVEGLKKKAGALWPEVPPEAMAFFGGEVLASGVVLWALVNSTGLDTMRWPGDLPVVLGLKMGLGSDYKIGAVLERIAAQAGLNHSEVEQLQSTFLELLQWLVVLRLYQGLVPVQRRELAEILARSGWSVEEREQVLSQVSEFLQRSQINAIVAKTFFEQALKEGLGLSLKGLESKIPAVEKGKIEKLII